MRLFTIFFLFLAANTIFLEATNESNNCDSSVESALVIEAVADTVTVLINESVSFNVLDNDIGEVYVNSTFNPVHGSIAWSLNGDMTYTPDEDYTGPDVFVYQIKDSEDNVASTSVFVNVGGMASTDLTVETFVECGVPEMGRYMVNIRIIGGRPPYEILVYYGDDLTNLFAEQFFLDQPVPFAYGPIFDDLKYAVAIKDSENTIVMDNKLLDYLCMSETGSTCVPETGLEMQLITTCDNGEQSDDVVATGGSGFYNYFDTPNDSFVPHTVVEDSDGCQNILFYHDIPPYTCPIANDDVVNGAYNAPFSLKPLLNDTGEGLYISDLKGLKHGTIQWRPDGVLAYFPNDDFVGIDTLEYEISDVRGNTARATILAVVPENDDVMIFWERDCTRAEEEGVYTINFTVAGGKPPYVIDGDFLAAEYRGDEVLSFIKVDGEDFSITAIDKENQSATVQGGTVACINIDPLNIPNNYTLYISCVEGEDYGVLTAIDAFGIPFMYPELGNVNGDTIQNGETYLTQAEFWDLEGNPIIFEGTVYCPPIAADDLYYNHPNFLDFPLTFNPLLNDEGHGLKLVDIETPNYGTVEWWEAGGTMNYRSNADFQGVETFDYTVEDIGGNRTSATITIIFANPINLEITYERDCFEVNNSGAENYTVNAFVSGGKPPYQVQVNEEAFFEISENGGAFNFEVPNGEGFQIYASDNGAVTHEATVDELDIEACSPLMVLVERNCFHVAETGTYELIVSILSGTPPFTISGSINEVLEEVGVTSITIGDGTPYDVSVVDATGAEFFESGGEVSCGHCASNPLALDSIEQIVDCTCSGDMIVHFEDISILGEITSIDGLFSSSELEKIIEIGDTIPHDAIFDMYTVFTEDYCYGIYLNGSPSIYGNVSNFCNPENYMIEAIDDFANVEPGEDVIINVLQNDTGTGLQINQILVAPSCGEIMDINVETGIIVYITDADTDCNIDTFVVEVEDDCGNLAEATVTIFIEQESELIVQVERDCTNWFETGNYVLSVNIQDGLPPFIISGSINETLESIGVTSINIHDGIPYEINVVDAIGRHFFEAGGEIRCTHTSVCTSYELLNLDELITCTCDEDIIVSIDNLSFEQEIESLWGFWLDENEVEHSLSIEGDTIPANTYFEINGVRGNGWCQRFYFNGESGISGNTSDFCNPENYMIEAIDDFASAVSGEDVIINVLQNDTGTDLQITQIISPPSCGQIVDVNVETGVIVYVADADTDCSVDTFVVEVEDDCGNLAEAMVTVSIEQETELIVQIERDCPEFCEEETYTLNISIINGAPPYYVSGSITDTLQVSGTLTTEIETGSIYEVRVIDSDGNEFYESGGDVPCTISIDCSEYIEIESISEIGSCKCDGSIILNFEGILDTIAICSIEGYWFDGTEERKIHVGDTIPNNAYIEIEYLKSENYECYSIEYENTLGISGNISDFCNPENYTIQAVDDFASAVPGGDAIVNVLTNDTGTNLQINGISVTPSCGVVVDINAETGVIVYIANADTDCSIDTFVVEVEDDCGNLAEAMVTVFIEQEVKELDLQLEKNCSNNDNLGFYSLNISISGGVPPYILSGCFNESFESETTFEILVNNCSPCELTLTDAEGAQDHEASSEICPPTLNESESQTFLCGEGDIILSLEGGGEGTTYNWYLDPVGTTPANPPTGQVWVNDEIIGPRILYVIAMSVNGCESEPLAIPAYHYTPLLVDDLNIEVDELNCEGYRVSFNITGGNGVYTVNGDSNPESFTSEWFSFEEDYSFVIDDSPLIPNCDPITVSGLASDLECLPVANNDFRAIVKGENTLISILANDTGKEIMLSSIVSSPQCGQIVDINLETGTVTYQGDINVECEEDSFTYEITDADGQTAMGTVNISFVDTSGELVVEVISDCSNRYLDGTVDLIVRVLGGVPPFEINGVIGNSSEQIFDTFQYTLDDFGQVIETFDFYHRYELQVTDAAGKEFTKIDDTPCCYSVEIVPYLDCFIEGEDTLAILTYELIDEDGNISMPNVQGNPQNDTLQNGEMYFLIGPGSEECGNAEILETVDCEFTSIENAYISTPNIQLFPNPNNGNFSLTLQLQQIEEVNIEVFDVVGRVKMLQEFEGSEELLVELDLGLSSGLYFVRVSGKDWVWTEKMIVE
ncbi:MAG: Ig-like domain-containing protein [Chitinophagales bacterium]